LRVVRPLRAAAPPAVDCPDVTHRPDVLGDDPHGLDADGDGIGYDIYG
jgi:hypothetical protein